MYKFSLARGIPGKATCLRRQRWVCRHSRWGMIRAKTWEQVRLRRVSPLVPTVQGVGDS